MKIACLALLDNGNFMRHLARGLRDYCHIDATAYHGSPDTYLHIPDPTVKPWPDYATRIPDADAYVLNDHTYLQLCQQFKDKPRMVRCSGTFTRDVGGWMQWDYVKHGTLYVSTPCDYTVASALPFSIQTLTPLIDHRLLPPSNFPDDHIIVGHAPTNPFKGTRAILQALHPYRKAGTITIDVIEDTPWQDAIKRKARCALFIDQVTDQEPDHPGTARGAFGVNALESLALGSQVLANPLHPYTMQHYPDCPIHPFPNDFERCLKWVQDPPEWHTHGAAWAIWNFDIQIQAPKWHQWLTWLLEGK
jgi:hypothetical protein